MRLMMVISGHTIIIKKGVLEMMDYNLFKKIVIERLKGELPPEYAAYEIQLSAMRKVNEVKDVLNLVPPENLRAVAMPNIYLDDMYQVFQECENLDIIIEQIINIAIRYTSFKLPALDDLDFNDKLDCLTINLISTEKNEMLLETVPHTDILDLSVIYRFIMYEEDDGFGTVILTNELLETLDITPESIHGRAYENTLRILPVKITEPFEGFYMMSNERTIGGAATMIFEECTDMLAEKIGSDFFIIPASIHEVYAVAVEKHNVRDLLCILEEGNRMYVNKKEILSQSIYFYDFETKKISIAGSYIMA